MLNASFVVVAPDEENTFVAVLHDSGRFPVQSASVEAKGFSLQRSDGRTEFFDLSDSPHAKALFRRLQGLQRASSSAGNSQYIDGLMVMSFDALSGQSVTRRPRSVAFVQAGKPLLQFTDVATAGITAAGEDGGLESSRSLDGSEDSDTPERPRSGGR
jgi:hypothetical protein